MEQYQKDNELTMLKTEIKQAIQKIEEEKNKQKRNNQWLCKLNSIHKRKNIRS